MVTLCQEVLKSQLDEMIYVERKSELRSFDTEVPLLELDVEQQCQPRLYGCRTFDKLMFTPIEKRQSKNLSNIPSQDSFCLNKEKMTVSFITLDAIKKHLWALI